MFLCRGGHGVHSPFVFDLITNVIEEKRRFYCYESLNSVRQQLKLNNEKITYNNRKSTIKHILKKHCFSEREDKFLFRLANYFKPEIILVSGSDLGLAPLYVTSFSKDTCCLVYEPEPSVTSIAYRLIKKYACSPIYFCDCLSDCLSGKINFLNKGYAELIIWNKISPDIFEKLLPFTNNDSVIVLSGIRSSSKDKKIWKDICSHSNVSVTVDLYNLGIVFFNPKLYRRTYKCVIT